MRPSTAAAYSRAWKEFVTYLSEQPVLPQRVDVAVANFLASKLKTSSTVASVLPFRSAVATTLRYVLGVDISDSPWVRAVLEAGDRAKPARPRYADAFDLELLTDYLELSDTDSLSLPQLLDKCLCLFMAAGIMRASDMARVAFHTVVFTADRVSFQILNPKNARGLTQPVVFAAVPDRPNICPVRALRAYLNQTATLRGSDVHRESLWLSERRPHLPLSSKSISARVLSVMQAAGIDTSLYKAHAVRVAAVAKAMESGVPLDDVLVHGRWRSENVFRVFYERSKRGSHVSASILS